MRAGGQLFLVLQCPIWFSFWPNTWLQWPLTEQGCTVNDKDLHKEDNIELFTLLQLSPLAHELPNAALHIKNLCGKVLHFLRTVSF